MLAMTFRVGEGILDAASIRGTLVLMWRATSSGGNAAAQIDVSSLGTYFLH